MCSDGMKQLVADDDCTGPFLRSSDYLHSSEANKADLVDPSKESIKALLANLGKKERKQKVNSLDVYVLSLKLCLGIFLV